MNRVCLVWLLLALLVVSGCVRRRMTIRSNPAGATVFVDDQQIGTTPVSTSYVYYGTRKIQLVKDGYESMTVMQKFSAPWYEWTPLDFFAENLWPTELRDEQLVDFELEPQKVVSTSELLGRAQQLRDSTRQGYTVPVPPTVGTPALPPPGPGQLPPPFYPPRRAHSLHRAP